LRKILRERPSAIYDPGAHEDETIPSAIYSRERRADMERKLQAKGIPASAVRAALDAMDEVLDDDDDLIDPNAVGDDDDDDAETERMVNEALRAGDLAIAKEDARIATRRVREVRENLRASNHKIRIAERGVTLRIVMHENE